MQCFFSCWNVKFDARFTVFSESSTLHSTKQPSALPLEKSSHRIWVSYDTNCDERSDDQCTINRTNNVEETFKSTIVIHWSVSTATALTHEGSPQIMHFRSQSGYQNTDGSLNSGWQNYWTLNIVATLRIKCAVG